MPRRAALLDACVLYPAPLRDILIETALSRAVQVRWTERIHDEWTRNLLAMRPDLTPAQLERTRLLMNSALPDAAIEGYERLIVDLDLPDPDDRHVLAAAVHSSCQWIVTFNLRDFPRNALGRHDVSAIHPDDFLMLLAADDATGVVQAVARCRSRLTRPLVTEGDYRRALARCGLTRFAQFLEATASARSTPS